MTVTHPDAVAYFDVRILHRAGWGVRDAEAYLDRYLYSGFSRVGLIEPPQDEDGHWVATVRFESYVPGNARRTVDYQRDRLASGGIGATEPTIYRRWNE